MSLPAAFTESNIKQSLEDTLKQPIQIKEFKVRPIEVGGNYCSNIYRITVKYTTRKCENEEPTEVLHLLLKDLFENCTENSTEYFMYETVLPEMNEILCDTQPREQKAFSPKVYLSMRNNTEQHLFEDLNARDYVICDRLVGFNAIQTKIVLRKLGQFHAASMVYKNRHPAIVAGMKECFVKSNPNLMSFIEMLINDNTTYAVHIIEKWSGYAAIAEKMRKNTGDNFRRKFSNILQLKDCKVRVIAHGDLWIKNLLIHEQAEDAIFLDYQNCFEGSPGIDFNNLLMTSVQLDVMNSTEKREHLIEQYYDGLHATLVQNAYDIPNIPTLDVIKAEIARTEYFAYYDLIFAFPQTNLSEELAKDMDLNGFFDVERMTRNRRDMFENVRVIDTYKYMLKHFDSLGLLD